jgi:hypothetical protein
MIKAIRHNGEESVQVAGFNLIDSLNKHSEATH